MTSSAATSSSPLQYLIEDILSVNEISLISGPSGSGKTTLALQMLVSWAVGDPVFGHAGCPQPYAWITCHQRRRATERTMRRLGIPLESIPHYSLIDPPERVFRRPLSDSVAEIKMSEVVSATMREVPGLRLLVLDGFSTLCPGKIVDQANVDEFLRDTARLCESKGVAILGTVSSPKGEQYDSLRDRILGAVAWASHTSTKFILEPEGDWKRTLHILAPNLPPQHIELMHQKDGDTPGLLVPYVETGSSAAMDAWLGQMEEGTLFTTGQAIAIGELEKVPRRTVERWIASQISLGTILKVDRGEYRKCNSPNMN